LKEVLATLLGLLGAQAVVCPGMAGMARAMRATLKGGAKTA